ncbi:MAG: hypothetical protein WCG80_17020 [Spirochaetales bacterium]
MTIKEMAEVAGVSANTVNRKARELFWDKFQQGKRATFTRSESVQIMAALRKKGFVELPQNEEVLRQNEEVASGSSLTTRDLDLISAIVSRTVSMTIQQLDVRLAKIEGRVEERAALLPAPKIEDKDAIRQLVAKEAEFSHREHSSVWNELYTACYYRRMGNFKVQAKNAGARSVIEYIDSIGVAGDVLAVAVDLWGKA